MNVGQRIAHLRERKGLSQVQMAKELNIAPSTLGMWETNKRGLKEDSIKQLADFFNVTTDYLLGQNQVPEWASDDDLMKLDEMLSSNKPMSYNGVELNEEDRERINAVLVQVFWERLKKQKDVE